MGQQTKSSNKAVIIIGAIVVVIAIVAAALFLMNQARNKELTDLANKSYGANITVSAEGWISDSSSPIPMRIYGRDFSGQTVDSSFLYDGSPDIPVELKRGTYTIEVVSSPINGTGGIYDTDGAKAEFTISDPDVEGKLKEEKRDDLVGESASSASGQPSNASPSKAQLAIKPIPPADATEEMIKKAYQGLIDAGVNEQEADEFYQRAINAHNEAAAAKEAARQESRRFSSDDFDLLVPDSWGGTDWHYTTKVGDTSYVPFADARLVTVYFYPAGSSSPAFEVGLTNMSNPGEGTWTKGVKRKGRSAIIWFENSSLSADEAQEVKSSID